MPTFIIDEHAPILVDFAPGPGVQRVALSTADMFDKSAKALDSAMNTIHHMARRVTATIHTLIDRPTKVEVQFGLKLQAEAGAIISRAGLEADLNVKLTWEREETR